MPTIEEAVEDLALQVAIAIRNADETHVQTTRCLAPLINKFARAILEEAIKQATEEMARQLASKTNIKAKESSPQDADRG